MDGRKTDLAVNNGYINAQGNVDNVLRPVVVSFLEQHPWCFIYGNARPQKTRLTQSFLARHDANILP